MCHEETGDGKFIITRHLSSHMEEISLAALPAGVEVDDETDSDRGTVISTDVATPNLEKLFPKLTSDDFERHTRDFILTNSTEFQVSSCSDCRISEEEQALVDSAIPRCTPVPGWVSKALDNVPGPSCLDCGKVCIIPLALLLGSSDVMIEPN